MLLPHLVAEACHPGEERDDLVELPNHIECEPAEQAQHHVGSIEATVLLARGQNYRRQYGGRREKDESGASMSQSRVESRPLACLEKEPRLSEKAEYSAFNQQEAHPDDDAGPGAVAGQDPRCQKQDASREQRECASRPSRVGAVRQEKHRQEAM